MRCKKCGAEIPEGAKDCSECGSSVMSEEAFADGTKGIAKRKLWMGLGGGAAVIVVLVICLVASPLGSGLRKNDTDAASGQLIQEDQQALNPNGGLIGGNGSSDGSSTGDGSSDGNAGSWGDRSSDGSAQDDPSGSTSSQGNPSGSQQGDQSGVPTVPPSEGTTEYYTDEFIFPDSDIEYLTDSDVEDLPLEIIRLGRYELYARHGLIFEDTGIQSHFDPCSWYTATYTKEDWALFGDAYFFNDYEIKNSEFLDQWIQKLS